MSTQVAYYSFACGQSRVYFSPDVTATGIMYRFIRASCGDPMRTYNDSPERNNHTRPTSRGLARIVGYAGELHEVMVQVRANFVLHEALGLAPRQLIDDLSNKSMAKLLTGRNRLAEIEHFFHLKEIATAVSSMIEFGTAMDRAHFDFCERRARFLLFWAKETLVELETSFIEIRDAYCDEPMYSAEQYFFDHTLGVEELKPLRSAGEEGAGILGQTFSLRNWHKTEVYLASTKMEKNGPPAVPVTEGTDALNPLHDWIQESQEAFANLIPAAEEWVE